jgi:uncharacterized protein YhaN
VALCGPVTERFAALTNGRYPRLSFDTHLKAKSVGVGGGDQEIDALSVGTREQLATLLRLCLAAQLKTFVLLDDQLVQSDWLRLASLKDCLRTSVRDADHQVVVITCRPLDYVSQGELPADGAPALHDDGSVVVMNVESLLVRSTS